MKKEDINLEESASLGEGAQIALVKRKNYEEIKFYAEKYKNMLKYIREFIGYINFVSFSIFTYIFSSSHGHFCGDIFHNIQNNS